MKYKIFVSANQKELHEERFAIKNLINDNSTLRQCFDVFLFEDLPAKGKSPITTYLKHVCGSDIYLGIIGKEYGDKGKDGLSATEREFRRFQKDCLRGEMLVFVKGTSADDAKRDKDAQSFFKSIKAAFIYKRFRNLDDLKVQVLNSLISFLDDQGEVSKVPFDQAVCREADYEAIDEQAVKDFLQNRAIKLKVKIPKTSIKDFLVNALKVVKKENGVLRPTNAGLLFFGKDPSDTITHHEIRIARFRGTARSEFIDSQEIKGPIYRMLEQVETFFLRNTRLANKIVEFKRVDIPEYPFEAIREAVINAIAHRNYNRRGAPIMVAVFDDRVEVRNPGGLLPGLNIKKLEGTHASRNQALCNIFHETMDMERFGTGIGKMKKLMKEHGLFAPEFSEEGDFFVVKFYGPGDKILDLVPSIPEHRQTDLKKLGLNDRQIEALRLMVNEGQRFSNRKYRNIFKVANKTAATDLNNLVQKEMAQTKGTGRSVEYLAK
ncbi:MAG: ATP-binding protein [Candidatus Omnitrophota bacterium]|nr:ATP-binding protein [Candidatus Omnitrophota bacterium]